MALVVTGVIRAPSMPVWWVASSCQLPAAMVEERNTFSTSPVVMVEWNCHVASMPGVTVRWPSGWKTDGSCWACSSNAEAAASVREKGVQLCESEKFFGGLHEGGHS